jgi:hypothetical protein
VPRVKQLWTKATEAFSVLREHEGWPYFPVEQAWFYATIPDAGDGHRFEGLVPFHMAGTAPAGEDGAEDVVEGEWEEVEG